jgi:formylglycine-generating enzyme required for sulfatase activity
MNIAWINKPLMIILSLTVLCSGCQRSPKPYPIFDTDNSKYRTALVIGNAAYGSASLDNAVKDARDMADTLENFGYDVIRGEDLKRNEMDKAIASFGNTLARKRGIGLFYYAGHAGEANGKNYLFPVDTNIKTPLNNAIEMNFVIDAMKNAQTSKNIIIMDACRERFRSLRKKSAIRGLAEMSASMGAKGGSFFIAYSTSPGDFASDSSGYTTELVKYMQKQRLEIEGVFRKVSRVIRNKTKGRQIPWVNHNLTDKLYFKPSDSYNIPTWKEPVSGIEFVNIKGGYYSMGCERRWADRCEKDEKPSHLVEINDFYISKYEITAEQWNRFLSENSSYKGNGRNKRRCYGAGLPKKDFLRNRVPIVCVSWYEANYFAKWLSARTGYKFSLPTEAQWEYTCRSGGKDEKFAGDYDQIEDIAWYKKNSKNSPCHVGLNRPNGLGLYDMTGNVWEWCQDKYDKNAYKKKHIQNNFLPGNYPRVLRGGSWITKKKDLRCPNRWFHHPSDRLDNVGFRLVRTP